MRPAERGTFDCSEENLFTLEVTAGLGLDPDVQDGVEETEGEGSEGGVEEP